MKCNNCGSQISESSELCPFCGTQINYDKPQKNKSRKVAVILLIIIFLLLLLFSSILLMKNYSISISFPWDKSIKATNDFNPNNNSKDNNEYMIQQKEDTFELLTLLYKDYNEIDSMFGPLINTEYSDYDGDSYMYYYNGVTLTVDMFDNKIGNFSVNPSQMLNSEIFVCNGIPLDRNNLQCINEMGMPFNGNEYSFYYRGDQFVYPKGGIETLGDYCQWLRYTADSNGNIVLIECFAAVDYTDGEGFKYTTPLNDDNDVSNDKTSKPSKTDESSNVSNFTKEQAMQIVINKYGPPIKDEEYYNNMNLYCDGKITLEDFNNKYIHRKGEKSFLSYEVKEGPLTENGKKYYIIYETSSVYLEMMNSYRDIKVYEDNTTFAGEYDV